VLSSTVPGYVDLSGKLAYQPDEARRLLDAAGWKPGADGIRSRNGQRLAVELTWSFPGFTPDLQLIKEQLAQIGVDLKLGLRTDAEIGGIIRAGRYDLRMADLTRPDPDVLLSTFSSRYTSSIKAPQPELDALLDRQSLAIDPAERAALVRQIQEKILDEGYGIPLRESSTILGTSPKVHGLWLSTPRWPVFYDTWLAD
jgi:peptide/nickel transport system substrate-binding protein